jgi:hypothetical protein
MKLRLGMHVAASTLLIALLRGNALAQQENSAPPVAVWEQTGLQLVPEH